MICGQSPYIYQNRGICVLKCVFKIVTQQTQAMEPLFFYYWSTAPDAGLGLDQGDLT